ncbi:PREDICTED: estradiol 17-beta-dehydrogenase 2 [Dufourea novaeangliae]|uniref:Estradiol 17-beta-dehydrogenase 2 n=1 Tax=Dufourea novaeangliae TaxID=178035 RepID=A0A154P594_DUFNO|nr:PREDICTED: estradiol 17-beta-dehydrogenase 2 [Dufourea novaeangliae]XP_015439971.1 PREDICTED: estradiol 17-beta-dehydrogenase 2 [Dufourea novaeangliae]KZC06504.1 Estradiol 17-beta-dehydrogenase 2 [Dufourea novaeangliae]
MGLVKYFRRHSTIFAIDLASSFGLVYSWNRGHKYLASAISLCCIGGTYLYSRITSRDKIRPKHAIIVTGCDSGLGYSLALHCCQLGATVIAGVLRNDGPGAEKLKQRKNVYVYPLDVTNTGSVIDFVDSVRTLLTRENLELRCLINNAAVMVFGEFEWQTEDQIRSQVEVNFLGTMRITRELMPTIRAHSSRIIMISSHCNIQPIPGVAAYGGTKAAINAWATAIRIELKKYGVKVVSFIPGSFVTGSNILARQAEHFETMRRSMTEEARIFYGDYFAEYSRYFGSVGQAVDPEMLPDPGIYEVFEGALLDKYPSALYKNESWRYLVYHRLFTIAPTCVRDLLVRMFVRGPSWTGKFDRRISQEINAGTNGGETRTEHTNSETKSN